jgi:hypothetical protein
MAESLELEGIARIGRAMRVYEIPPRPKIAMLQFRVRPICEYH